MSIKSWWKSLFREPDVDNFGLPKVTCDVPMPEVKPCKSEKDISEPVFSFIKLYKDNHRRFKITLETYSNLGFIKYTYNLFDRVENKSFSIIESHGFMSSLFRQSTSTKWMTEDEMEFCFKEIREFWATRKERIQIKQNIRARERLTKLYKGE